MHDCADPIGQAIYLRTDSREYAEEIKSFRSLEEMVAICSRSYANLVLEKVLVFAALGQEGRTVTLDFVSAAAGAPPGLTEREFDVYAKRAGTNPAQ